ncbi:putative membrane protein YdjX (TVP38/TMEM64 family) [Clostridium pascui]|uniref:TVP38/TMEM64 family protein n=1 Tax=Clostridium pascui TaxID=46609 RepID=UPI00195BAEC9|nr:TVP38/TMEM64 family protein [Clostridium pascui]MBM7869423.1 putative membrane protein YdjX (TVP38/TMEM64 family) [Clostridium pascui]
MTDKKCVNCKFVIKIVVFCIVIMQLYFLIKYRTTFLRINKEWLENFIRSQGALSRFIFVIIFALKPLIIVIPAMLMTIIGGSLFGPLQGLLLSLIGFFLSGTLAFFLARLLGEPFVDKIVKGKGMKMNKVINKNGVFIIALIRFIPVFHYDIASYTLGLTKIKYKDYIIGSILGVAIETTAYAYLGENIFKPHSPEFIISILSIIILGVLGWFLAKKKSFK